MYKIVGIGTDNQDVMIYNDYANNTEFKVENPKLTIAEDTAGSLTFKMPPTHPNFDKINLMSTIIRVFRDDDSVGGFGKLIWAGRITEQQLDMWEQRSFTCEGVLGYLNDTVQSPTLLKETTAYDPSKILKLIIDKHNAQIQKVEGGAMTIHKTFVVGTVDVESDLSADDEDTNWYTDWNTSWDAINQLLLDRYPKGHLRCEWRKKSSSNEYAWHLDFLSQDNYTTSEQTIEFGKNLVDFTRSYNMTELKTVCLPRGAVIEDQDEYIDGLNRRVGVTTVNNTQNEEIEDFNDQFIRITQAVSGSTALSDMGWIVQEVVWDEITDKTKLKKRAKKWLRDEQFDNMSIEIRAIDLHYLNPNIKSADILTKIRCISKPHGMDKEFPITKIEIELDKPENSKLYLGSSKQRSFTGSVVGKSRGTDKEVSDIWKKIDNTNNTAKVEYPQWGSGTWPEIFAALTAHHEGLIDLYRDYGWRPGDVRTVSMKSFTTPEFTTFDGDGAGHVKSYTESAKTFKLVLLNKGDKIISYTPSLMVKKHDEDNTYDLVPDTANAVDKECAFVVGIFPEDDDWTLGHVSNVTYSSSNANKKAIAIPNGLPFFDQNPAETKDNWDDSWVREFLELVYDNLDIEILSGGINYKTENFFMQIKTPLVDYSLTQYDYMYIDDVKQHYRYVYDKACLPTMVEMLGNLSQISSITAINGDTNYSRNMQFDRYPTQLASLYKVDRETNKLCGVYGDFQFDYFKTPTNRKLQTSNGVNIWLRGEPAGLVDSSRSDNFRFVPTYNTNPNTNDYFTYMPIDVKGKLWWTRTTDPDYGTAGHDSLYIYNYDRWPSVIPILCI